MTPDLLQHFSVHKESLSAGLAAVELEIDGGISWRSVHADAEHNS